MQPELKHSKNIKIIIKTIHTWIFSHFTNTTDKSSRTVANYTNFLVLKFFNNTTEREKKRQPISKNIQAGNSPPVGGASGNGAHSPPFIQSPALHLTIGGESVLALFRDARQTHFGTSHTFPVHSGGHSQSIAIKSLVLHRLNAFFCCCQAQRRAIQTPSSNLQTGLVPGSGGPVPVAHLPPF
jgi:hypothetical protein